MKGKAVAVGSYGRVKKVMDLFFIFFELCRYASLLVGFLARALLAADNNTDTFRRPEEGYSRLVIYPDTEILVGGRRERRADNGEGV
jgi:hypothetical protein